MATLDTTAQLTWAEVAKRIGLKGETLAIIEVLQKSNPIMQHAPMIEANGVTDHKLVRRAAEPGGSWRQINGGVTPETSATIEVREVLAELMSYMEIDRTLVKLDPNPKQFIQDEANAFLSGMGKTLAYNVFYGNNVTHPDRFTGLAPRLNSTSQTNVVSAGGSGNDLSSVWVVQWGRTKAGLLYPRGHRKMGIQRTVEGFLTITDSDGKKRPVYQESYAANIGMFVGDDRCIARICNIETSGTTNIFDEDLLIQVLNRMPDQGMGARIYCSTTVKSQMDVLVKDKTNVYFQPDQGSSLGGVEVMKFRGIPVHICESILDTEAVVS